ncbi:DUF1523 family protein [Halochromatium salexigens]|uniref:DUF1523 domain-containing protein n=1 Tax=Halochromatium salexigens TaxID=49447 RepID=A0AAJ0XGX8_HALSE|nr:DUF1523 family protein [Halochromatium salexigens]MBK5931097.1 hypothetical protein [Halochromatium salexigens]
MKQNLKLGLLILVVLVLGFVYLFWGPKSWEVQITGATGDGRDVQYRIETVKAGTSDTLIFRNEDAGFMPPYFKFDAARLQSIARRVSENCPQEAVDLNGYGLRIPWLSMFPNATSIDAPERCRMARSAESPQ